MPKGVYKRETSWNKGKKLSKEHRRKIAKSNTGKIKNIKVRKKISESKKGISLINNGSFKKGQKPKNWDGGYNSNNIPKYDTYANQISYAEQVRRNKEDRNILEVKCAYCGKWYIPKRTEVQSRRLALDGKIHGEYRFYCSKECKKECPIFKKIKYPKGYKKASSREVQPELRQLVFERDNYICQNKKCKSNKSLHCHHVEGIRYDPLESADMDKCITYCKKCHKEVHEKKDCGYHDMQCKEKNNG